MFPVVICQGGDEATLSSKEIHEMCKSCSEFAEVIMTGRQGGVPMSGMMDTVQKINPGSDEQTVIMRNLMSAMITSAYSVSIMSNELGKATVISEFRDICYSTCVKEFSKP